MNDDTNNLPSGGTGDDDDVSAIADALGDIFDDPETDNAEDDDETTADEADESEAEGEDSSDPDDAEDEDAEAEDPDDESDDDDDDGSDRVRDSKGRFVSDDYRVKLSDGTSTTIAELKAGALRQGDYTRKTQEVSEARRAIEADRERVSQQTQQLDQQVAQVSWVLDQFKPQVPPPGSDPEALDAYHQQVAQWQQLSQGWEGELKQREQRRQETVAKQTQEHMQQEAERLYTAIPALRDPSKRQAFYGEAARIAGEYGISEQELQAIPDHRFFLVLRDAMQARRMKANAPKAKEAIAQKPRMNKGRKRSNPKAAKQRSMKARTERLNREGTLDAGVASLMDMDL